MSKHKKPNHSTIVLGALAVTAVVGTATLVGVTAAHGDEGSAQTCEPKPAWTEESDWVSETPGDGWVQIDKRETPGTPDRVEHKYQREVMKHIFKYQKFTNTTTTHKDGTTTESGWSPWSPAQFKESETDAGTLGSGPHGKGTNNDGSTWVRVYEYRQVGSREVGTGQLETSDWVTSSPGEGWTIVDTRTIEGTPGTVEYRYKFEHPAVECETPETPEEPSETPIPGPTPEPGDNPTPTDKPTPPAKDDDAPPAPTEETRCSATKCEVIYRDHEGNVIKRVERDYSNGGTKSVIEEGF